MSNQTIINNCKPQTAAEKGLTTLHDFYFLRSSTIGVAFKQVTAIAFIMAELD